MDSLGNRCSSFTPRRAFCARGFDRSCLDVFRAPVVHVAHAQNKINHAAVSDRQDDVSGFVTELGKLRFETIRIGL